MPEYDDDKPTHRWVRIGYAKTADGRIDKARIGRPEHLPAAEAKRLVDNNHGVYLTDEQAAELQAASAEADAAGQPAVPAAKSEQPADIRKRGWGASSDEPRQ